MKKKVAITGGIGSGKTTVIRCIENKGYPIFSCDEIYKDIIQSTAYVEEISKVFPSVIKEGEIDRSALASMIFSNENHRTQLNSIAHPLIMNELIKRMDECTSPLVFAEVPLLFEGGFENLFDECVVLIRKRKKRIKAVKKRDNLDCTEIESRIQAQFDYDNEKAIQIFQAQGVEVIDNNDTPLKLQENVEKLLEKLLSKLK